MRWLWTKGESGGREERELAEARLHEAQVHVIIPLRQMRQKNHVGELISELIQRKTGGEA